MATVPDTNLLPRCFEGKKPLVTKCHEAFEGLSQHKLVSLLLVSLHREDGLRRASQRLQLMLCIIPTHLPQTVAIFNPFTQ